MAGVIEIKKIKNVKSLKFTLPRPGVHLLTGRNGSGKTTLLAALYRIGYKNAFSDYFKTTSSTVRLDSFAEGSVTYRLDERSVSYNYGNLRWAPTPKKNAELLSTFGFPKVVFIAANAKRIEPSADEVRKIRAVAVDAGIASAVARVLADDRFKELKYVNTKRGGGTNKAFLLPTGQKGAYYSEKNFSLGELCVIKLVSNISAIPNNSLVLIDEIEMALHPRAQASLLDYLVETSARKNLTVIFSTHSASLIKRAGRKRIICLENDGAGNIRSVEKCFPAQALGDIAIDEDISPDVLCFVEDAKARFLLEALMDNAFSKLKGVARPICRTVPVGGFKEVIHFLANSDQIFSDAVKRYAVLDKDVEDESLDEARRNEKHDFLAFYDKHKARIKYLPITPELGVAEMFFENFVGRVEAFRTFAGFNGFDIVQMGRAAGLDRALVGDNRRKAAKGVLAGFVDSLAVKTGESEDAIYRKLLSFYVSAMEAKENKFDEVAKEIAFS